MFKFKPRSKNIFQGYVKISFSFSPHIYSVKLIKLLLDTLTINFFTHSACCETLWSSSDIEFFDSVLEMHTAPCNKSIGSYSKPGVALRRNTEPPRKCCNNYESLPVTYCCNALKPSFTEQHNGREAWGRGLTFHLICSLEQEYSRRQTFITVNDFSLPLYSSLLPSKVFHLTASEWFLLSKEGANHIYS